VIERRHDIETKFRGNILNSDNILILAGKRVCLIFDGDLASYLVEHATAMYDDEHHLERVGYIEEDF